MCRYASRENEVDEPLKNHVFVDLYTVVRQGLLIGESSYSLKNVEHLYLSKRGGQVPDRPTLRRNPLGLLALMHRLEG